MAGGTRVADPPSPRRPTSRGTNAARVEDGRIAERGLIAYDSRYLQLLPSENQ